MKLGENFTFGVLSEGESEVVGTYLNLYSGRTREEYIFELRKFFRFIGHSGSVVRLIDITYDQISFYIFKYLDLRSRSAQKRSRSVLKSFFSFLEKIQYLAKNPTEFLSPIESDPKLVERILLREEVFKMIELEKDRRNHLILKMLYVSAMRVSELCSLKWENLIWIEANIPMIQVSFIGKGKKERGLTLEGSIVSQLDEWKDQNQNLSSFVFFSREEDRSKLHPTRIRKIVTQAALRAGITKKVSPHWFRHSHASHALDQGAPLHLVRDTLGHASIQTTGEYLHARPDDSSSLYLHI